ncbi:MAG: aromatic ring-hydroxylating dioxygenase subunit alpha [Gemmatimonadota bacterium]|nr:aromatic ring-hydroxylating dioxygenase subunit alpha [Gemmatimonadota bacterium]
MRIPTGSGGWKFRGNFVISFMAGKHTETEQATARTEARRSETPRVEIDANIGRASTLPAAVYSHPAYYELQKESVFARSWQWAGEAARVKAPGHVLPFTLLEGCLDEPLVLVSDEAAELRCLSNVCTHRGALVVEGEGHLKTIRCRYHGRRFAMDGSFVSMPEFDGAEGFPSAADDLPRLPLRKWGPLLFTGLDPAISFEEWIAPVEARVGWMPLEQFRRDPNGSRDYLINANWALYCDNYLEEFHIPYVHQGLSEQLDYSSYYTEIFSAGTLQMGIAKSGEVVFELPAGHPDEGKRVAAFYFWLFPNVMLNFYPWGLSLNVVNPLGPGRSRVSFIPYVWKESLREKGVGGDLHKVEMEDEEVVESVQRGVSSRLYDRGRFSPRREPGTHHFHRLLANYMNEGRTNGEE